MLMTFQCIACADITMFGSVGLQMVKMMGEHESASGAINEDNVPAALEKLKAAVAHAKENDHTPSSYDGDEQSVSIATRAVPLIDMLNAAIEEHCPVMWQSE